MRTKAAENQYENIGDYEDGIKRTLSEAGASGAQIKDYIAGKDIDISNLNLDEATVA